MNKKGFMLGEYTLKTIIAVLCILLLVYLLFSLYSNSVDQRNLQLAEASLSELVEKMREAKESGSAEVIILNPHAWLLKSYKKGEDRPEQCYNNCLCICDIVGPIQLWWKDQIDKCNEKGVCKNFEEEIDMGKEFGYSIVLDKGNGGDVFCISDAKIEYSKNKFTITKK